MTNVRPISPMLAKTYGIQQTKPQQEQAQVQTQVQNVVAFSPLLAKTLLAQNKQKSEEVKA